jgi:hypothetical protein
VMIVLIACPSPALKATNHPNQGYRLLAKLPTLGSERFDRGYPS